MFVNAVAIIGIIWDKMKQLSNKELPAKSDIWLRLKILLPARMWKQE